MEGAFDVVWILTPPHVHGRVGLAVFRTVREGIRKKVLSYLRGWDYTPSAQDYREIAYVATNL